MSRYLCLQGVSESVKENVELKRGEYILEEVKKICCHGYMFSSYGVSSETVNARIDRGRKTFRELGGVLSGK